MPSPIDLTIRETARALIIKGLAPITVANQTGVAVTTIYRWSERFKWAADRNVLQAQVGEVVRKAIVDSEVIAQTKASNRVRRIMGKVIESQAQVLADDPAQSVGALANSKEGQGHASVAKTVAETASVVFGWGKESESSGLISLGDLDGLDAQTAIDVESSKVLSEPVPQSSQAS